jgi:hypothetical protein
MTIHSETKLQDRNLVGVSEIFFMRKRSRSLRFPFATLRVRSG